MDCVTHSYKYNKKIHELADKYKLKNKKTNFPLYDVQSNNKSTTKDLDTQYDSQTQKSSSTDGCNNNNRDVHEIIQDEESSKNVDDLSSKFVADSIIDLSISQQRSTKNENKPFTDIFEDSSLDNVDQMESLASINEYNEFHDTEEYPNEVVSVSEISNDNKDYDFSFNDSREIDEDSSKHTDNDYSSHIQTTFKKKRSESNNALEGLDIHADSNTKDFFGDSNDNVTETKDDWSTSGNKRSEDLQNDNTSSEFLSKNDCQITNNLYNLRNNRTKTAHGDFERTFYDYDYNLLQINNKSNVITNGMCATQMSPQIGIKIFGDKAVSTIVEEYEQVDRLNVVEPVYGKDLTYSKQVNALNAIDLIKEKRCGKIKGRTVADGRKQCDFYSKYKTSSPVLSLEGFLGTMAIDAAEERHIAIADVTGAFLKADMDKFVLVKLQGPAIEVLLKVNRKRYENFVTKEKKKNVLYIKLLKAMYGTLKAPLLWYTLFTNTLKEDGFIINEYDNCVANKLINGSQFTICWYVDDIKFSHKDIEIVKKVIKKIERKFDQMTVTHGNVQTYLGMNFEIKDKVIHLEMEEYLKDCMQDFPAEIDTATKTPCTKTHTKTHSESSLL